MRQPSEEEVHKIRGFMDENEKHLHDEAKKEGYKDEICGKCSRILLAHKHFVGCSVNDCPMRAKNPDGTVKPDILDLMLGLLSTDTP